MIQPLVITNKTTITKHLLATRVPRPFKNNRRNIRKNKLRTFEARSNENLKNLEQEKKSGSYKKKWNA